MSDPKTHDYFPDALVENRAEASLLLSKWSPNTPNACRNCLSDAIKHGFLSFPTTQSGLAEALDSIINDGEGGWDINLYFAISERLNMMPRERLSEYILAFEEEIEPTTLGLVLSGHPREKKHDGSH